MANLDAPNFEVVFAKYLAGVTELVNAHYAERYVDQTPSVEYETGPKYVRVFKRDPAKYGGSRSVHSFVDRQTGNILKGSWKSPVKNGVRGNIFDEDLGLSKVSHHGPKYLR